MALHALAFAFLMVAASTLLLVPLLLHGVGLAALGWTWKHVALFNSMVAATDAVSVTASLKQGEVEACIAHTARASVSAAA